jgi:hypothetical protein
MTTQRPVGLEGDEEGVCADRVRWNPHEEQRRALNQNVPCRDKLAGDKKLRLAAIP